MTFETKLWDLLPDLYRRRDHSGDLAAFLKLPAATLDRIQNQIEDLTRFFDVDTCPESILPSLAALLGVTLDPTADGPSQRRHLRETIPRLRRKSTLPAMARALRRTGWDGRIEETFRKALRLNRRALVNGARLPGRLHSLGVYRVVSDLWVPGFREPLQAHHPAGTRAVFLQRHVTSPWGWEQEQVGLHMTATFVLGTRVGDILILNRNGLNTGRHLTQRHASGGVLRSVHQGTKAFKTTAMATCLYRWHGRSRGFTLNRDALSHPNPLINVGVRERVTRQCCPVRPVPVEEAPPNQTLSGQGLNHSRLALLPRACHPSFQQRDLLNHCQAPPAYGIGVPSRLIFASRRHGAQGFKLGASGVSGPDRLTSRGVPKTLFGPQWVTERPCFPESAGTRVDRWAGRKPGFSLNRRGLQQTRLTEAGIRSTRAAFDIAVSTTAGSLRRLTPLTLNQKRLNHTGMWLSVDRHRPLRLGLMKLNRAGFRVSESAFHWIFHQHDQVGRNLADITAAHNQWTVTRWPQEEMYP